jgi:hypothetical protein
MTLHRWRKALASDRIAELELENSRLRRLVTDLLLEKVKVEAAPWPGKRKPMKRNYQVGETKPRPKTKVRKRGRPLLGNRPMTSAERVRKHRALNALLNAD